MTSFHDLSVELVELIATYLDPSTFCAFRLASKEIYDRTYQDFVRRITSLGFFLAPHSLNVLLDICNHESLAKKFHTLRIGSHTVSNDGHYWAADPSLEHDVFGFDLKQADENYLEYFGAQNLYRQGDDSAAVAYILAKMTSIQFIQVGDWDGAKQWERPQVTYHGLKIFERETGSRLEQVSYTGSDSDGAIDTGVTHCFKAVLRALAATRVPIKQLAAGACEDPDNVELLPVQITEMPELTYYFRSGLQRSLSTLRALDLAVGFESVGERNLSWLPDFVNLAINLQELTLTCEQGHLLGNIDKPGFSRSYLGMNVFLTGAKLQRLRKFTLQNAVIGCPAFCSFLLGHKDTISEIGIRRVSIHGGSWHTMINEVMVRAMLALRKIEMAWLEEVLVGDVKRALVTFDQNGLSDCERCEYRMLSDIDFKGNDCKHTALTVSCEEARTLLVKAVDYYYSEDSNCYVFPDGSGTPQE